MDRHRGLSPAQTEKALGRALWSRRISDLSPRGGPSQSLSEFSVEEECSAKLKVNAVMQNAKHLTWLQPEDPCWLLIRAFRSASRTALGYFRALSKNEDELQSMIDFDLSTSLSKNELRKAFSALGAGSAKESTSASEAEFQESREMAEQQLLQRSNEDLRRMKASELRPLLAPLGLRVSFSSKAEGVQRLTAHRSALQISLLVKSLLCPAPFVEICANLL